MASSTIVVEMPRKKLYNTQIMLFQYFFIFMIINFKGSSGASPLAPAMFVLGDSLFDVGNNNYIHGSNAKANFLGYGIDFPNHKPTGRFSNGKIITDFLAEMLGLRSSPPYLLLLRTKSNKFSAGVNFASGGSGIFDFTHPTDSIVLNKQIEDFGRVHEILVQQLGQVEAEKLLSKSVFAIDIGGNDIFGRFGWSATSQAKKIPPQQYVASMVHDFKAQLKRIYDLGGRKFVIFGMFAIGCCPTHRVRNKDEACNKVANFWAAKYNQGLQSFLQQYQTQLKDFKYSYFDNYKVLLNYIQHPAAYGFKEAKAACCGTGKLNAEGTCNPTASICTNRTDHIFWDRVHPTEAAARMIAKTAFDGPIKYAFPVNIRQLVSV